MCVTCRRSSLVHAATYIVYIHTQLNIQYITYIHINRGTEVHTVFQHFKFQIRKFEHVWRQTLCLLPAMRVLLPHQSCLLPV